MAIKKTRKATARIGSLDLSEIEVGPDIHLNMLIHGLSGVGKTRLMGSAQKYEPTSPILVLDIEGGTTSIGGAGIKIVRPQNFNEIQDIYDYLRFDNTTYRSVGVDSLTEMQKKLSMGDIMGDLLENAAYTNLASHTPPDRYDWLQSSEQMRRFIRAFKDLAYLPEVDRRIHVIFTALSRADEKTSTVCPSLPGQLGLEVGGLVDVVAEMSIKLRTKTPDEPGRNYRHLCLQEYVDENDMKHLAKARTPYGVKPLVEIWQPTMSKLVSQWMVPEGE